MDLIEFKNWLKINTNYTKAVITDIASRVRRANNILEINNSDFYLFELEHLDDYKKLSTSVRSQIKKSVKLYMQYLCSIEKYDI